VERWLFGRHVYVLMCRR